MRDIHAGSSWNEEVLADRFGAGLGGCSALWLPGAAVAAQQSERPLDDRRYGVDVPAAPKKFERLREKRRGVGCSL